MIAHPAAVLGLARRADGQQRNREDHEQTPEDCAEALGVLRRQPDVCFRWGGDEFVLILSGTPADETGAIAERLHAEVNRICKRPDESPIRIRFAVAELREGMTPGELARWPVWR